MDVQAIVGLVVVLLGAAFAVYQVPKWQVRRVEKLEDRIALETEARKTLAQIMGGLFFLATLFFTWKNLQVAEKGQALEFQVAQDRQIAERFTRAVEQLGDKRLEVRLGGIYALERIAKDSPKDHWTIMEVLTAFVRENAPWKGEAARKGLATQTKSAEELDKVKPRADVQAVLWVLGRRTSTFEGENQRLNLNETDMRGAWLNDAHFEEALLYGANLEQAYLTGAHLERALLHGAQLDGVKLWAANLEGANLENASLRKAHLFGSNLMKANLDRANLEGAFLHGAHLEKASLKRARLRRAQLISADLTEANLSGADLEEAAFAPPMTPKGFVGKLVMDLGSRKEEVIYSGIHLRGANLSGAHMPRSFLKEADLRKAFLSGTNLKAAMLEGAHLEEATLEEAHLEGAFLKGAHLEKAYLRLTHLEGADLRHVTGLTKEQVESAIIDENTKLPDYLKEPEQP